MKRIALKSPKLQLHRETLRALESSELMEVQGAVITTLSCEAGGSCNTCNSRGTCTTRYC